MISGMRELQQITSKSFPKANTVAKELVKLRLTPQKRLKLMALKCLLAKVSNNVK